MKPHNSRLLMLGALLIAVLGIPFSAHAGCQDIAKTGQLNVLTLNTLFDLPAALRAPSMAAINQFAKENNVHVLLLQEAVATDVHQLQLLLGTSNSARDLQRILNQANPEPYELFEAWESGIPLVLTTANAILSRCDITRHFSMFLPIESEKVFQGIELNITRNVQMAQMRIPGYGNLHIYNTHLCAGCSVVPELQEQVSALLKFVQRVEAKVQANHVVLGGDFNLNRAEGDQARALYDAVTREGFRDVYAEYQETKGLSLDSLCWGSADKHCTDGVSPIQGLIGLQTGAGLSSPKRIDYLFLRGVDKVLTSRVVFNPLVNPFEPAVSDHSGVFAKITLGR